MMTSNIDSQLDRIAARFSSQEIAAFFDNTVFIVAAPRSGSTLLFQLLSHSPDIWTISSESHRVYAQFPQLPSPRNATRSGRLDASHADGATSTKMRLIYLALLQSHDGEPLMKAIEGGGTRKFVFLEKTPRNSLNIAFLLKVFPKARFIFLHRDPRENISSLIEGWAIGAKTGQFVTSRRLPDWPLNIWCFLLPPGWEEMRGKPVPEIAAFQWRACNEKIMHDLAQLPDSRHMTLSYDELLRSTGKTIKKICDFGHFKMDQSLYDTVTKPLPLSSTTASKPVKDKWRQRETEILQVMPEATATLKKIEAFRRG